LPLRAKKNENFDQSVNIGGLLYPYTLLPIRAEFCVWQRASDVLFYAIFQFDQYKYVVTRAGELYKLMSK